MSGSVNRYNQTSTKVAVYSIWLLIFFGYFVKFIEIFWYFISDYDISTVNTDWALINWQGVTWSGIATFFFSVLFYIFGGRFLGKNYLLCSVNKSKIKIGVLVYLLVFFALLSNLLAWYRFSYGSVMGAEPANLPWYAGTLVYRTQQYFIPGIFLSIAYFSIVLKSKHLLYFCLFFLFFHYAILSLVMASKAGIFNFVISLIIFSFCVNFVDGVKFRIKKKWVLFLCILAFLGFVVGNEVRSLALTGVPSDNFFLVVQGNYVEAISSPFIAMVNRIIGIEGVAIVCSSDCFIFDLDKVMLLFRGDVIGNFTEDIVGVSALFDFRSPGFLGGAIIGFGFWIGIVFSVIFCCFYVYLAWLFQRNRFYPPSLVIFHSGLIFFIMEGGWSIYQLLIIFVAVFAVEFFCRCIGGRLGSPFRSPA